MRDTVSNFVMERFGNFVPALIRYTRGPDRVFEYASLFLSHYSSRKRKHGQRPTILSKPKRWISSVSFESLDDDEQKGLRISLVAARLTVQGRIHLFDSAQGSFEGSDHLLTIRQLLRHLRQQLCRSVGIDGQRYEPSQVLLSEVIPILIFHPGLEHRDGSATEI